MPERPTLIRPVENEVPIVSAVQANGATPPPGLTEEDLKAAASAADDAPAADDATPSPATAVDAAAPPPATPPPAAEEEKAAPTNGATPPPATAADADINALWIDPGVGDPLAAVHLSQIPTGKPKDYFRTCTLLGYRQKTVHLAFEPENAVEKDYHLVAGPMRDALLHHARPCVLVVVVDRIGAPRIWPLDLPRDGESDYQSWQTFREAAKQGEREWVRLVWEGKKHTIRVAEEGYAPEPDFSKLPPFSELIRLAYGKDKIIQDREHAVYRALFGIAANKPIDDDVPELDI